MNKLSYHQFLTVSGHYAVHRIPISLGMITSSVNRRKTQARGKETAGHKLVTGAKQTKRVHLYLIISTLVSIFYEFSINICTSTSLSIFSEIGFAERLFFIRAQQVTGV